MIYVRAFEDPAEFVCEEADLINNRVAGIDRRKVTHVWQVWVVDMVERQDREDLPEHNPCPPCHAPVVAESLRASVDEPSGVATAEQTSGTPQRFMSRGNEAEERIGRDVLNEIGGEGGFRIELHVGLRMVSASCAGQAMVSGCM
ncbi:hypothetical protein [Sedimentitalea arenosa]|uniref:Uncharacterized protein n=1 Tax=Sedimentitalea arenosa TaxID=2798803 RepID=A0A8J7JCF7_9RHOB|nr:hypothetical protein [Arenibacterium arenosum]MBJ6373403.1 hypothetical protein [Arenibacterium arenosum]